LVTGQPGHPPQDNNTLAADGKSAVPSMKTARMLALLIAAPLVVDCAKDQPTNPIPAAPALRGIAHASSDPTTPKPSTPTRVDSIPVLTASEMLRQAVVTPPTKLVTPTFDGSGEATHPAVARFAQPWHGWKYWLAMTPYKGSSATLENPSIITSNDGIHWSVPAGLKNPLVATPAAVSEYNSDPHLLYDAGSNRLVMYYRVYNATKNIIYALSTADGVKWENDHVAFSDASHDVVSPALELTLNGDLRTWYVASGAAGCDSRKISTKTRLAVQASTKKLEDASWQAATNLGLRQPNFLIWHLSVQPVAALNRYLAIYPAFRTTSQIGCLDDELFLATSKDGQDFTSYPLPIVSRKNPWIEFSSLYRADLTYDALHDLTEVWFSAYDMANHWNIYYTSFRHSRMMLALNIALADGFQTPTYSALSKSNAAEVSRLRGVVAP
jgi:hypothetical protein